MLESDHSRRALLLTFALLCFINSYDGRFVFDDAEAIVNNKDVVGSSSVSWWWNVIGHDFWGTPLTSNLSHKSWRPLTTATFKFNFWLSNLNPIPYHLVNIFLHGFVVLLLYEVISEALTVATKQQQRAKRMSFWCSWIFAVHPVHTECVSSIVGRAELLCAVFFLWSFKYYLSYVSSRRLNNDEEEGGGFKLNFDLFRCIVYSSLSILSKEQGITSLAVCLLYDVLINSRRDLDYVINASKRRATDSLNNNNTDKQLPIMGPPIIRLIHRLAYLFVFMIIQFTLRMWVIGFEPPAFTSSDNPVSFHPNWIIRSINYNYLYALNAWILINPAYLCFDYSMGCIPLIESVFDYRILFTVLFLICLVILISHCCYNSKIFESKCISLALVFLITPFLPASNLLFRVGFVLAERVLYLPSIGSCILVALAFDRLRETFWSKNLSIYVNSSFIFLLLIFGTKCLHRNREWVNESSLFISGAKVCPTNAKVHYNLGKILNDFGSRKEAEIAYKNALKLHPNYDQAMNNLANMFKDNGNFEDAEKLLERAVEIRPNFAAAWMNLGIVKTALKKYSDSERSYLNALRYRPNYADCYFNMGNLYLELGRESEALNTWVNATRLKPNHEKAWINIIILLDNIGDSNGALQYGAMALVHVTTEPGIYFAMANCLGKLNKFAESEYYFERAIRLDPSNANYYNNLGVLYHRWKKYSQAESMYSKALQVNPELLHTKEHLINVRKHLAKLFKPVAD